MGAREDALIEVVEIARRHGLTSEEVARAIADDRHIESSKSESFLSRLFGYIGGAFVFAGLAIFIGM